MENAASGTSNPTTVACADAEQARSASPAVTVQFTGTAPAPHSPDQVADCVSPPGQVQTVDITTPA